MLSYQYGEYPKVCVIQSSAEIVRYVCYGRDLDVLRNYLNVCNWDTSDTSPPAYLKSIPPL